MNRIRSIGLSTLLLVAVGDPAEMFSQDTIPAGAVRIASCDGPAFSLPDTLLRTLAPRTGRMHPDDHWADLASSVPGGFAGVFYDHQHRPILMLTKPTDADAAKKALAGKLGFPVEEATVRTARWTFLQLVDWYNYLLPHLPAGFVSGDKDEAINRIRFGVATIEARDRFIRVLLALGVPCDLVVITLERPRFPM